MKVLLLGDYSSFHINLKKGLLELGVDCKVASNGDGWKKIGGADFELWDDSQKGYLKSRYNYHIRPFLDRKTYYGNDVVQLIHPSIFSPWINKTMLKCIFDNNKKSYVSVCGDAYSVYKSYIEGKLGNYYVYDDNPGITQKYRSNKMRDRILIKDEEYVYDHVKGIIPIMFEYAEGVRERRNCLKTIPIPFDSSPIEYTPNRLNNKLVIMHGLFKEKSKGSSYILDAFRIIKDKYPNDVEIIVDGKLPLNEYLKLLKRVNVLVDQCKEHCYGMNACYGMALGKVVLGGASESSLRELGLKESPVIHIEPNTDMIVSKLDYLIKHKDEFEEMGRKSREFVETFHDCKRIAQEYLNTWAAE